MGSTCIKGKGGFWIFLQAATASTRSGECILRRGGSDALFQNDWGGLVVDDVMFPYYGSNGGVSLLQQCHYSIV